MSGFRDVTDDFMVEDAAPAGGLQQKEVQRESDPHRLAQRQKQIDLGKNTLGYQRYRGAVPREQRNRKTDPVTPDVYQICSKRAFEGQVKKWRRMLHTWDPPAADEEGGELALLPVVADMGLPGASSNPPAPAAEQSDDFEHVSHADAVSPASKNGAAAPLRPAGSQLPLKIPSVMRKRAYEETVGGGSENMCPAQQQAQQQQHRQYQHQHQRQCQHLAPQSTQPTRLLPEAKRRSAEKQPAAAGAAGTPSAGGAATPSAGAPATGGPQSVRSWAEQRYEQPELDYSVSDDEVDGDWQYLPQPQQKEGAAPAGRFSTVVYNNPAAADAWNEDDIQI